MLVAPSYYTVVGFSFTRILFPKLSVLFLKC